MGIDLLLHPFNSKTTDGGVIWQMNQRINPMG